MKSEQRLFLQRLLLILSCVVAIVSTCLWVRARATGSAMPAWMPAVLAYGWTFVAFFAIDRIARAQARKKRPDHFRKPPGA